MVEESRLPPLPLILKALAFAADKHRNQRRKDREASPYINHPIALASVLCNEAGISDETVLAAALLHDTVEDTDTTEAELSAHFGPAVCRVVMEVSDDKALPKVERKRLQVLHANQISHQAKLIKLADKICNLRDIHHRPPADWSAERRTRYREWAKAVIDQVRGSQPELERLFDDIYRRSGPG